MRDTFAALFAHLQPEEMQETVSQRLASLGAGEELESSHFQDAALQFMNRYVCKIRLWGRLRGSIFLKLRKLLSNLVRISMEEGGVSLDERTLASLLLQAPRKTLRLLVADATESAGTDSLS